MPRWLSYSLIAIVLYGVWGIVSTAASKDMASLHIQVISTLGMIPVAVVLCFSKNLRQGKNLTLGMIFAFVTGLCGSTGNIALLESLKHGGDASTVFPLTGMYPLVTVVLARIFLKEKFNMIQAFGIGLALAAIWLFSVPPADEGTGLVRNAQDWRRFFSPWMAYALGTLVLYGVAAITQKFSTNNISNELSTVVFASAFIPVALVILVTAGPFEWGKLSSGNWILSILFGGLIAVGTLALFAAYRWGKASIVTALTALYPALTVILAIPIFHEKLNVAKGIAIVLALAAGVALSYEGKPARPEVATASAGET